MAPRFARGVCKAVVTTHTDTSHCEHRAAGDVYFASEAQFEESNRARRTRLVTDYLRHTVPEPRRAAVLASVAQELADLGVVVDL